MTAEQEKIQPAKACPRCGGYYPGDCTCPNSAVYGGDCDCDGCKTYREMEKPENHIHHFCSTRGDIELCLDPSSKYYGWEMLVMECDCGETKLVPLQEADIE